MEPTASNSSEGAAASSAAYYTQCVFLDTRTYIQVEGTKDSKHPFVIFPKIMLGACAKKFPSFAHCNQHMLSLLNTCLQKGNLYIAPDYTVHTVEYCSFGPTKKFLAQLEICSVSHVVMTVKIVHVDEGINVYLRPKNRLDKNSINLLDCIETREWA